MVFLFYGAVTLLILTLAFALESWIGLTYLMKNLEDVPPDSGPYPMISLIAAARNEERNIEEAVLSFLALDYPNKEIIVVNDRSTDRTGAILDGLKPRHPELQVIHLTDLPSGWLGKNHAHYKGAEKAKGEWLLFTDGDVIMEKSILKRAARIVREEKTDHLAAVPQVPYNHLAPQLAHAGFMLFFNLALHPWLVKYSWSPSYAGIGAFNLFKKEAYQAIGTHQRIAMRPDDDIRLGQLIKKKGLQSRLLFGFGVLKVEWYVTLREMIEGLMKNTFAGMNYSVLILLLATVSLGLFFFGPLAGLLLLKGAGQMVCAATVGLQILLTGFSAHRARYSFWTGLGLYFSVGVMLYILWRASLRTLLRGGIEWRGTFYPLKDLKQNTI